MRRRALWATLAFIALSALVHFVLGGSLRVGWPATTTPHAAQVIAVTQLIRRTPPSPAPSPAPRPAFSHRPNARPSPPHRLSPSSRVVPHRLGPAKVRSRSAAQPAGPRLPAPAPTASPQLELPQIDPEPTPLDARDIIIGARFTKRVDPDYPALAADAGMQGTVIVLVTVAPDGSASDFRVWVSSGNPALDHAALVAAQRSTYAPPQVDGVPAYETYRIIESFEKP